MYETRLERFYTPGGVPVMMHVREGTNDHNTTYSCLDEDEYLLPRVSGVAIDIGAYTGAVSVALAADNPDLRVIAIEPVPENADLVAANLAQNGLTDRVTLIRGAIGSGEALVAYRYTGSEIATHHAFVGNASILDRDEAAAVISYPAITLADLLVYEPSLIKIDCEGGEWDFLVPGLTGRVPIWVGEWHPGGGTIGDLLARFPDHDVTFTGPQVGPGGFRATLR